MKETDLEKMIRRKRIRQSRTLYRMIIGKGPDTD